MDAQHLTHLGASALTYNSWRAGGGKGLGASDSAPRTYSNPSLKSWTKPAFCVGFKLALLPAPPIVPVAFLERAQTTAACALASTIEVSTWREENYFPWWRSERGGYSIDGYAVGGMTRAPGWCGLRWHAQL